MFYLHHNEMRLRSILSPHFTDEKAEAQRVNICLNSHGNGLTQVPDFWPAKQGLVLQAYVLRGEKRG
jgi:hypothetical protein